MDTERIRRYACERGVVDAARRSITAVVREIQRADHGVACFRTEAGAQCQAECPLRSQCLKSVADWQRR